MWKLLRLVALAVASVACPSGSSVGRIGPAPALSAPSTARTTPSSLGQSDGVARPVDVPFLSVDAGAQVTASISTRPLAQPTLRFRNWREGDTEDAALAGVTTITALSGAPAVTSDGTLALVRFTEVVRCQPQEILLFDISKDARKERWIVPTSACEGSKGLPISKGGKPSPNPLWTTWEVSFARATRDQTWLPMAALKIDQRVEPDQHSVRQWSGGGMRVTTDNGDPRRTVARSYVADSLDAIAEVDLTGVHKLSPSAIVVVAEAFVFPEKKLVVARFVVESLGDRDEGPPMDHVLRPSRSAGN
jgi:hypothetical protein